MHRAKKQQKHMLATLPTSLSFCCLPFDSIGKYFSMMKSLPNNQNRVSAYIWIQCSTCFAVNLAVQLTNKKCKIKKIHVLLFRTLNKHRVVVILPSSIHQKTRGSEKGKTCNE